MSLRAPVASAPGLAPLTAPHAPVLQRACAQCADADKKDADEPHVARLTHGLALPAPGTNVAPPVVHKVLHQQGEPLDTASRQFFEPRLGQKLDHVRIHCGAEAAESAAAVNARAYTVGRHIVLGAGQGRDASPGSRKLMAHELAHVIQQGGAHAPAGALRVGSAGDVHEHAADQVADVVMSSPTTMDSANRAPLAVAEPVPVIRRQGDDELTELRDRSTARVHAITISCTDMRMRIETDAASYYYTMEECTIPPGDYRTSVSVTGNDFHLDFGEVLSVEDSFGFAYRVEPGQPNPATMLENQSAVAVHVVDDLPAPVDPLTEAPPEPAPEPEPTCLINLADRELVPRGSHSQNLFEPIEVPETTIWAMEIPLGWFGWVEVEATVSANVSGNFNASYGPGRLTDICLTHLASAAGSSSPIDHPLLGPGSHASASTFGVGGQARFNLPAQMTVSLRAQGNLRIAGDYLSVINLAAAEGSLTASGSLQLSGAIDGSVGVVARFARESATLEHPTLPLALTIEHSHFEGVDLAAAIGLHGRAALGFSLDGGASFSIAGKDLWSENWNLASFNTGVGWQGGLVYSPNPGLHWNLGEFGSLAGLEGEGLRIVDSLGELDVNEDASDFDADAILPDLFDYDDSDVTSPEGLSADDALPFEWRKPGGLYAPEMELPNADPPVTIRMSDPPTSVSYYNSRGRLQNETLGVADWPSVGRTFQYYPYDARRTPEQARFNRVLDALGFSRAGLDAEHVWDVKLVGLAYDRFDNLWPASNQEQQLAGAQHSNQIRTYENQFGNVNGRYFEIVRVRGPEQ
jgi:hypothetical protein